MDEKTRKIAELNDGLRKTFDPSKGRVVVTQGVGGLPEEDQASIFGLVKSFNSFTEDNDPYGEHDMGKVEYNGHGVFWKIDYYDHNMQYHSGDAADPEKTVRVLTIMLTHEY